MIRISAWTAGQKIVVSLFGLVVLGPGFWLGFKDGPFLASNGWGILVACIPFIEGGSGTRMVYRYNAENFKHALLLFVLVQVAYVVGLIV